MVRRQEKPIFCWIRLKKDSQGNLQPKETKLATDIKDGRKIIVARIEVFNCQLNRQVCIAQRRSARPPKQPYIACGEEQPTMWDVELIVPSEESPSRSTQQASAVFIPPFKLVAEVDTSKAGFLTTPSYSARIDGLRLWFIDQKFSRTDGAPYVVDGLINIDNNRATPKKFALEVLLLVQNLAFARDGSNSSLLRSRTVTDTASSLAFSEQQRVKDALAELLEDWHIVWMGVEE
ncbi:hypothetical protein ACF3DV_12170 [Chlorogloeopsis fritschii PCC 9212]|uniref:hypothetical protein n=1 Tax=Chlorogloeopsis fritschii TaxID=1124 RepID=UPI00370DA988